jgi:hypothetical protein
MVLGRAKPVQPIESNIVEGFTTVLPTVASDVFQFMIIA